MVGMPHDAFSGKVMYVMHSFPRYDASSFEAYDEIPVVLYQIGVKSGSVATSVVNHHAFEPWRGVYGFDDVQDLVVLAFESWRA